MGTSLPAAVIGSGPNGLAAAVTLARAGVPVTVFEAASSIGGGTRTTESVMPGALHDECSAVHPMALATPFFQQFEIEKRVQFVVPDISYAHPLDGDRAALAYRDLGLTSAELGRDGRAYERFYEPLLRFLSGVIDFSLGGSLLRVPRDLPATLLTGLRTLEQGTGLWNMRFKGDAAPALLTGVAAHSPGPMPSLGSSGVSVLLGALGHASGWPIPVGGSRALSDALAADVIEHGGSIHTDHRIADARELSDYGVLVFDTSARGLAQIAGDVLPRGYRRALNRFRYGDAASKVDFVLNGPIPWSDPRVAQAGTVHVGGTRREIAAAEREVARGGFPERPYVLLSQPSEFDPSRADEGLHTVWSYTHVPHGSTRDVSEQVVSQIERFAPGFRSCIVAMRVKTAAELEQSNSNFPGGDYSSGAVSMRQLLARPVLSRDPWRAPTRGIYLASASTSPGPGVHGLNGWYAAQSALRNEYGLPAPDLGLAE